MARHVVGYAGGRDAKVRKPIYVDDGPSSAAAKDAFSMFGRVRVPDRDSDTPTGGAGPIERRQITAAERDVRRDHRAPLITLAPDPVTEETAMESPDPEPTTDDEDPVPSGEELELALIVLADASVAAMEALRERREAEGRWHEARVALEAAWAATGLRPTERGQVLLDLVGAAERVVELGLEEHPDVEAALERAQTELAGLVVAESMQDDATSPAPVSDPGSDHASAIHHDAPKPAAGGGPGVLGRQQKRILDATLKHRGDRKAAARELGTTENNVQATLHNIGKKGLLPLSLIAQLPASFARYMGV